MSDLYRIDLDHEHREYVESLLLDIERWVVPVTEPNDKDGWLLRWVRVVDQRGNDTQWEFREVTDDEESLDAAAEAAWATWKAAHPAPMVHTSQCEQGPNHPGTCHPTVNEPFGKPPVEPKVFGNSKDAQASVEVFEIDGERDYILTCYCAVCMEFDAVGVGGFDPDQDRELGVYFVKHHVARVFVDSGGHYGYEYDTWVEVNEVEVTDDG